MMMMISPQMTWLYLWWWRDGSSVDDGGADDGGADDGGADDGGAEECLTLIMVRLIPW